MTRNMPSINEPVSGSFLMINAKNRLIFFLAALLAVPADRAWAAAATNGAATLPLSDVILYSSGVGYFERSGDVTGRAQVDLRFKTEDINDLLKSMVAQDSGNGHVSAVTYGSRDPLTRTLRTFGLDLT